jgi:DNA-binding GntR family transcriptional regulator
MFPDRDNIKGYSVEGINMVGKLSKVNLNDYKPLREIIFNTLREAIIVGELKPGERLMEVQLADKMGVSRTPVREAIRKLELEGLVNMLPRKGAHVAELSMKDIMDVLEVRASLDGLATRLSTERITDEELKELKHVFVQFSNYIEKENLNGSIKKDVEFHDIIYRSSHNDKLIQISNNLREQVQRFRVIYLKDYSNQKELIKEHQDIYEAIFNKTPEIAQNMAQMHIKIQEEAIIKAMKYIPGKK